jgi:hypothetical protein
MYICTYIGARVRELARTRSAGVVGLRAGALDVTANMFKVFFPSFFYFLFVLCDWHAGGDVGQQIYSGHFFVLFIFLFIH